MGSLTDMITQRVTIENSNFDLGIAGLRGGGKSMAAIRVGVNVSRRLGNPFSIKDNVHLFASDFLEKIDELTAGKRPEDIPPGIVLIADEASRSMDSQAWWQDEVKAIASEMETYRTYRFVTIFTLPSLSFLTKRPRDMLTATLTPDLPDIVDRRDLVKPTTNIDHYHKYSRWKFKLLYAPQNPGRTDRDKVYCFMPRDDDGYLDTVEVKLPPVGLVDEYETKKQLFLRSDRSKRIAKLREHESTPEDVPDKSKQDSVAKILDTICEHREVWGKQKQGGFWEIHRETAKIGLQGMGLTVSDRSMLGYKSLAEGMLNKKVKEGIGIQSHAGVK